MTTTGKTDDNNALINAFVPRKVAWKGEPKEDVAELQEIIARKFASGKGVHKVGMKRHSLSGYYFSGNAQLFETAVDDGEVSQD